MTKSCECSVCQHACERVPGWFKPEEIEKVAEFLNLSLQELFDTKLRVLRWFGYPKDTLVITPATTVESSGEENDKYKGGKGQCVFFSESGKCGIHPVKPYECKNSLPCNPGNKDHHEIAAKAWKKKKYQKQVFGLLTKTK